MLSNEVPFLSDEETADSTHVGHAYHALSLNEHRSSFNPMLWYTRGTDNSAILKQCWFLGHHSDVGGASCVGAANLSLAWMITQIQKKKILDLDVTRVRNCLRQKTLSERKLKLVDPMTYNHFLWLLGSKQWDPTKTLQNQKTYERIHCSVKKLREQGALLDGIWKFQEIS